MKREIKFRGKCIHSDIWCYGNYATNGIEAEIQGYDVYREDVIDWREVDVEPDTIGQYTGLKDKNGKEIYEGDIVYSEFADGSSCMFLVGWNNKLSCFGVMDEYDYQSKQLGYDFPEFNNHLFIEVLKHSKILKVIGNIHDNPELLKGAVNKSEFDPNRSFEEKREILRKTQIDEEMSYKERLRLQKLRHGL